MKFLLLSIFLSYFLPGFTQTLNTMGKPIELQLTVEPPSPRLNESCRISVEFSALIDSLYRAYVRQNPSSKVIRSYFSESVPGFMLTPARTGRHEVGPLNFTYANLNFTTNKLIFYVDDSVQATTKGLWIRYVGASDSTFCIMIEQRIPVENKENLDKFDLIMKNKDSNLCTQMVRLNLTEYDYHLFRAKSSQNSCSMEELLIGNKTAYYYNYYYNICFDAKGKDSSVFFSKDTYGNLPPDYNFKVIKIR